ncbi:MAG: NAD(P)-dependent oxidoreductase [Actinomycetes bacterium]
MSLVAAVRPEATGRIGQLVADDDRIVITGAGGWFGQTTLALLVAACGPAVLDRVLATASRARSVERNGYVVQLATPTPEQIAVFEPTTVINCAFPTREMVASLGWDRYVAMATRMTSQWLALLHLPSVQTAITFSSGAAVRDGGKVGEWDAIGNPYGYLKRVEEDVTRDVAPQVGVGVTVLRTWSVSGAFVAKPDLFAFSDLINQARTGKIEVRAGHEVWRRYCGIDDAIAVAWSLAAAGGWHMVSSGGPLVEVGELATRIASLVANGCRVERATPLGGPADDYFDRANGFADACHEVDFTPADLDEQIRATVAGLPVVAPAF